VDEEFLDIVQLLKFRKRGEKAVPERGDDYQEVHNSLVDEKRSRANERVINPNKKKRMYFNFIFIISLKLLFLLFKEGKLIFKKKRTNLRQKIAW